MTPTSLSLIYLSALYNPEDNHRVLNSIDAFADLLQYAPPGLVEQCCPTHISSILKKRMNRTWIYYQLWSNQRIINIYKMGGMSSKEFLNHLVKHVFSFLIYREESFPDEVKQDIFDKRNKLFYTQNLDINGPESLTNEMIANALIEQAWNKMAAPPKQPNKISALVKQLEKPRHQVILITDSNHLHIRETLTWLAASIPSLKAIDTIDTDNAQKTTATPLYLTDSGSLQIYSSHRMLTTSRGKALGYPIKNYPKQSSSYFNWFQWTNKANTSPTSKTLLEVAIERSPVDDRRYITLSCNKPEHQQIAMTKFGLPPDNIKALSLPDATDNPRPTSP